MGLVRKLVHAVDNYGFWGAMKRGLTPASGEPEQSRVLVEGTANPFDDANGTETGGYIPGEQLATGARADFYSTAYYGITATTLRQAIEFLPESPKKFTFVDLGCGKGRALLVAGGFAFKQVIGVELAPELYEVAKKNTAPYERISVVLGDAASVVFPEGPLVVFLYHPFLAPVLQWVLRNLETQVKARRQKVYVLMANPSYPKVFARFPFLEPVWETRFGMSAEEAAVDRHGSVTERYVLYKSA